MTLVRVARPGHGFMSWRVLVDEYEPALAARRMAVLSGLLNPSWRESGFLEQWLNWEREVQQYEDSSGSRIPDDIRCAVVAKHSPARVRDFLRLSSVDLTTNYDVLRSSLRGFFVRSRVYDSSGRVMTSIPSHLRLCPWISVQCKRAKEGGKVAVVRPVCGMCSRKLQDPLSSALLVDGGVVAHLRCSSSRLASPVSLQDAMCVDP